MSCNFFWAVSGLCVNFAVQNVSFSTLTRRVRRLQAAIFRIPVLFPAVMLCMTLLAACSSSRKVPQGSFLLDRVSIKVDSTAYGRKFDTEELSTYLRQLPNHKMLWSIKFRLGVYNMSGNDTTRWWNRLARRLGEAPVIYDSALTQAGVDQLRKVLVNKGYLNASVRAALTPDTAGRKMKVEYDLSPGIPHTLRSVEYEFADSAIRQLVMADSALFPARPGTPLDRDMLEQQREAITARLRNRGYYAFAKELITFNADTTEGSALVDLTMRVSAPSASADPIRATAYLPYVVRRVRFITEFDPMMGEDPARYTASDTTSYRGVEIWYDGPRYLRPAVLYENCFIRPGHPFSQHEVDRTYQALSRLSILKFISVRVIPVGDPEASGMLDVYVLLTPGKSQVLSLSLEGTNSEGDLGMAVGLGYSHRNLGKGSETLSAKFRAAYESLSGNLDGLLHDRYLELSADVGVTFPKFKAPFLSEAFKRSINASTELAASMNYQERPEYTRIISTAGLSYKWVERHTMNRHTYTPIDINYVYLPRSTNDFINQIAPDNPLLRYSYEDHFIMRMGYSFYYSDKRSDSPWGYSFQRDIRTLRVNAETAGNLLYALSNIFDSHSGPYKVFGIHYSQYVKAEGDFALLHRFDTRNALAFHAGLGIGIPYGNSAALPFEKRFYGGGANGVRGWAVRTLGPGCYPGVNSVSDFINQCGDIRIEVNAEYRAKLFWLLELGAFIDIGNIWTIREYSNQPGGVFRFDSFYRQLAAAYGLGLRLDFNYFLLRFDLGMKAHNPALGAEPWPLIHPDWHRDSSFHFSIGYPF